MTSTKLDKDKQTKNTTETFFQTLLIKIKVQMQNITEGRKNVQDISNNQLKK